MTPRVPRSRTSTEEHLDWQFDFLRASLERYDAGHEPEALRVASALRVLCYDKGRSRSLLGQLGYKDSWRWVDTGQPPNGWNLLPFGFLHVEVPNGRSPRVVAPCEHHSNQGGVRSDFRAWWAGRVFDIDGHVYTREDLVTSVANMDGGAHVDPSLKAIYHQIAYSGALGIPGRTSDSSVVVRTPVWEALRQIGYEVQATATAEIPDRFAAPTTRDFDDTPRIRMAGRIAFGASRPPLDEAGGSPPDPAGDPPLPPGD